MRILSSVMFFFWDHYNINGGGGGTGAIRFDNFDFKPDLDFFERIDSSKLLQNLVVLGEKSLECFCFAVV